MKGKGKKERYTLLNVDLQRIARRNKKVFVCCCCCCLSEQCKEIEENNRMGRARDLFKKIRDTKGTFHSKMGTVKEETVWTQQKQKILRRRGKNTQIRSDQISRSVVSDSL